MEPSRGRSIGPYRLVEPIGEGGMGVVWRARDTTLDRDVAIKFLPTAFARDAERLARFQREAKAAAALSHPGILAIYGFGEQEGTAYAVMELLEGETLRERLARGPVAPDDAVEIARQAARALAAAHDRGIVHRDLKPENLFLTRDGHMKILDFGLAAQTDVSLASGTTPDPSLTPTRTTLTAPGVVLGTTDYLSPEQVRGVSPDARSDVFSFGTVLHEMLTGRRPFRRESPAETLSAILHDEPPDLAVGAPGLERIVRRCLAKSLDARFASARDLAEALDATRFVPSRGHASRARPWLALALVAVLGLIGLAVWKARTSAVPPPASLTSIGEAPSRVPEANEYFERGLLFLRAQLDLGQAQKMFDRAVQLDPSFGSARAVSAITGLIALHEGFTNDGSVVYASERDAREVLAAQPELASAHAALGAALLCLNRKEQARRELEAANRLSTRSQPGALWTAIADRHAGRLVEAEARLREILDGVPLFWAARIILSDVLFDQGRIDEAEREAARVFEQDPSNLAAARSIARLRVYRGDTAGAREVLERVSDADRSNFRIRLVRALLLAREGQAEAAVAALDPGTLSYADIALFAPAQVAEVYALSGRTQDALDWLDRAVRDGDERSGWFRRDELLAGIRDEPRFALILDSIDRAQDP